MLLATASGARSIEAIDEDGDSALFCAARNGQVEATQALVDAGCAIDRVDGDRMSALGMAAECGHASVVKVLLTARANIHHVNVDNDTPLDLAIDSKLASGACVALLVEARQGADAVPGRWASQSAAQQCD